tara:strand:+ start:25045 stop:26898 length:1854 start_codon:yes stop_codon:yes gene_type:complete
MKLEKVLDQLNSFEKNSFLKLINDIVSEETSNKKEIEKVLSNETNKDLKNVENINVAKIFALIENEYTKCIKNEFVNTSSQLDIIIDILIRDGNCIMKLDWFSRLYEEEIKQINKKVKALKIEFESEKSNIDEQRKRDYKIYKSCLEVAYNNDIENNSDRKVTIDELSILLALSNGLDLSQEEIKLINYMILPIEKHLIDDVVNNLKNTGVILYSKKQNTIYIADEVVRCLRKVRGKQVADKFFRRVLKLLREPQINLICRKHNIDWKASYDEKVKSIINQGILFSKVLSEDAFREGTNLTEKKNTLNEICNKGLNISPALKGKTLEEKIDNLIEYFDNVERDEKVGISIDGYEKLLIDLGNGITKLNQIIKSEFELQEEDVLKSNLLLDYNIKPRDIIELIDLKELESFCKEKEIKTRSHLITNILEAYKDSENLFLENYVNIGLRKLNELKENNITIKESELGVKFEDLTKKILAHLGFNVDEKLRKQINTKKDKIDILINLGNNDLILVECKTLKESGYNKFSSVSRQLKSYAQLVKKNEYNVIKSLLIAPEFSDDFISECELEYELNLSLITAESLIKIHEGFKETKMKELPFKLLMRDVLIQEDRILKAIKR